MKKLEKTMLPNCRGEKVEVKVGDFVNFINENDLKIFGLDPNSKLPLKYSHCGSGTLAFLYEVRRKKTEEHHGKSPYQILDIFERESPETNHIHEIFSLQGLNGAFEESKKFLYKVE